MESARVVPKVVVCTGEAAQLSVIRDLLANREQLLMASKVPLVHLVLDVRQSGADSRMDTLPEVAEDMMTEIEGTKVATSEVLWKRYFGWMSGWWEEPELGW